MSEELMRACAFGDVEKVGELLKNGAKVDAISEESGFKYGFHMTRGMTPLTIAAGAGAIADKGRIACIDVLLAYGAEVNHLDRLEYSDSCGLKTALMFAVQQKCFASAEHLIKCGADLNIVNHKAENALHLICSIRMTHLVLNEERPFIELLAKNGININAQDIYGWTPIMNCARYSINVKNVELLLDYGANVLIKDNQGGTLLDVLHGSDVFELDDRINQMAECQQCDEEEKQLALSIQDDHKNFTNRLTF